MDGKKHIVDKENKIETDIQEWIARISEVRPELGGFAVCPFAAKAKTLIVECQAEDIMPVSGYDVVFYVVEDYLDLASIQFWVEFYNKKFPEYIFLEDCATYNTYINGIQSNNGKHNIIFVNTREVLRKYRVILRDMGYYSHWNDEMLREVLGEDIDMLAK